MEDENMEKLKPCPFCGGEGEIVSRKPCKTSKTRYYIQCKKCGCKTREFKTVFRSDNKWNDADKEETICIAVFTWNKRV